MHQVNFKLFLLGCGKLFVADGNWKLRYAHCMWKVPITLPGFGEINYPRICPLSPKRGHAFCIQHCKQAALLGFQTELRPFLERCGMSKDDVEQGKEHTTDECYEHKCNYYSGAK